MKCIKCGHRTRSPGTRLAWWWRKYQRCACCITDEEAKMYDISPGALEGYRKICRMRKERSPRSGGIYGKLTCYKVPPREIK